MRRAVLWSVVALCAAGCKPDAPEGGSPKASPPQTKPRAAPPDAKAEPKAEAMRELPTRFAKAERVVAIGDVHGDLDATRRALEVSGALGDDGWVGGPLVLVQTGDQLDRGDDEPEILDLLERLAKEAEAAGGAVHVLNGNHEFMNVMGDLRYVTPEGMTDFKGARGRTAAFAPGGPYAKRLGRRNTVVIVGDTVFVHGGVEPQYAKRIDTINKDARRWLMGLDGAQPAVLATLMAQDSPIWSRRYSAVEPDADACASLGESLRAMSVSRMVVGHTVQKGGITSACDEKVWRIDTGMAKHYGGSPQALEITDAGVKILR